MIDVGVPDVDGNLGLFRVGKVVEAGKHPNADKLQLCQVDVGEGEPRQIVCGAWNFGAGRDGRRRPAGRAAPRLPRQPLDEREAPRRGLARDDPLRATSSSSAPTTPGSSCSRTGASRGRRSPTSSRSRPGARRDADDEPRRPALDGRARARGRGALRRRAAPAAGRRSADRPTPSAVDVTVEDFERLPALHRARVHATSRSGPSPHWLRARLHLADMRSISNVVDVTNYVMHVYGTPLHAFDRLAARRRPDRRAARRAGEELRTLDGTLRRSTRATC